MASNKLPVVGISGSLRKNSYNTSLLKTIKELSDNPLDLDIVTLEDIPLFNEDVEATGWPPRVQDLRDRLAAARGVIFSTPEYNYSIPGVLKNAIDWLSRPEGKNPIFGKPAAIIGATPSRIGTARAQAHLRQVVFYNGMPLIPTVEVLVARAQNKFDAAGRLTDESTQEHLRKMTDSFADWINEHENRGST